MQCVLSGSLFIKVYTRFIIIFSETRFQTVSVSC